VEVADALATNANAAKALVHRARVALAAARRHVDVDVPTDRGVVERMAQAIEAGAVEALAAMLAEDAWGIVDGGGVVRTATRPTLGGRAIARQWANARTKLGQPVTARVHTLSGEPAIVIRLADLPEAIVAVAHVETRAGAVVALRVHRDPARIARFSGALRVP
jgi:RNA polymerase sigma-70 factor (ECF subfamily)